MFLGIDAKKMPPTLKHRPAIWECMLGTVYAMNDEGIVKYFDYALEKAKEFANIANKKDIRVFRKKKHLRYTKETWRDQWKEPRLTQMVLWCEKGD